MSYEEREAQARRVDDLYEQVDEAILALLLAALATGLPERVALAGDQAKYIIWDAYRESVLWNTEAIPELYGAVNPLWDSSYQTLYQTSDTRFYQMSMTAARRVDDLVANFENAAARREALAQFQANRQGLMADELARQMEATLREYGITGFTDAAGRRWKLKTYAEMAARTTTMDAELAGVKDRVVSEGGDLVAIVGPLDYPDGCPPSVFGGPYSVTGATKEYHGEPILSLDEAIRVYGVFHPRCRHSLVPVAG